MRAFSFFLLQVFAILLAYIACGSVSVQGPTGRNEKTGVMTSTPQSVSNGTGFVTVTGMSASITVSGKRPVMVAIVPDMITAGSGVPDIGCTTTTNSECDVQIKRGSTVVGYFPFYVNTGAGVNTLIAPSFMMIDNPTAGTYTYTVQMQAANIASTTITVSRAMLKVIEL